MNTRFWKWMSCAVAVALALGMSPGAAAECGLPNSPIKPMSWQPQQKVGHPSLLRTDWEGDDSLAVVGMWHVIFTAQTQDGVTIPGAGAVIDNAVVVWHSDGTEIMNSARPAQDGNFCLGVWKHTGHRTYLLNHIPWMGNVFDPNAPANAIGIPQAGAQLIEKIVLSPDGNSYSGTFTLHAYDTSGGVYTRFTGTLSAKRITPETPFSDLL